MRLRHALTLLLTFLPNASFAAAMPARVVSMNLCADELVLRLADRAQVAGITGFARDPRGFELRPPLTAHVSLTPTSFQASFTG